MATDWHELAYKPHEEKYSETWWKEIKEAIFRRDHYKCFRCETKRRRGLSVHHIISRIEGGEDNPENLITLCSKCHDIVEMEGCRTLADIVATIQEDTIVGHRSQHEEPEPDRIETFERPEWHKWVYGGQKKSEPDWVQK